MYSGKAVLGAVAAEGYVADDAQRMAAVFLVQGHGLLVVASKHHLGTPAHTQHLLVLVERLGGKGHGLFQQKFVDMRQHRRVKSYRVLHQQYHLHAYVVDVVLGVHLVFQQLDDS